MRAVEGIPVDRAKLRLTATYALSPELYVGVEVNPLDDDVGPLVTWRAVEETRNRPALIFGTSSDRIGTPSGRALYATLAKDVEGWTGLPVAPYVGTSYGGFEHEFELIGGVNVRWSEDWTSTHLFDGENLHHLIDRTFEGGWRAGLVVVQQESDYYFGLSLGASLDSLTGWMGSEGSEP